MKKGMAINISVLLVMVLVMLVVVFLLAGVFKDFIFQKQSMFGLTPGTDVLRITDSDASKRVTINCKIISSANPPDGYEYAIAVDQLGFSYTTKTTVYPVFVYKLLTATSVPENVEIPGRLSFSSLPLRYKPEGKGVTKEILTALKNQQSVDGEDSVVIGFFKKNDKCFNLAKESTKIDEFIQQCAKTLEAETSVPATRKACI